MTQKFETMDLIFYYFKHVLNQKIIFIKFKKKLQGSRVLNLLCVFLK